MNKKEHWESVYHNKLAEELSWYQEASTISLSITQYFNLQKDAPIIDVGGGASVFVDGLLQAGFEKISVLDLSFRALELAKTRLGKSAEKVTWLVADVTEFEAKQKYVFWHDRAVFHFLTSMGNKFDNKRKLKDVYKEFKEAEVLNY
ncbi:MAG TPA: class I SAM-dependent methyltransferase, partial [Thiomicrorhabdus sp.]|nr:class I SAM-dependent methyltransferase [Thiomicrorhabdus sp.]